jgi:hypothetical protein
MEQEEQPCEKEPVRKIDDDPGRDIDRRPYKGGEDCIETRRNGICIDDPIKETEEKSAEDTGDDEAFHSSRDVLHAG